MDDRAALMAAILANPGEDVPRLALADWFDEHPGTEDAELRKRIRIEWVPDAQLYGRTKAARSCRNYAAGLLVGAVPKTWYVWPIEYPLRESSTTRDVAPHEDSTSWSYSCATAFYSSSRAPFAVGIRYGFISAVAAPLRRLIKALPAVVACQPVHRVAVTELFFEFESLLEPMGSEMTRQSRVIRRRVNRIPDAVFARLTPPARPTHSRDLMRVYPTLTAAHEDLGRAVLNWARAQAGLLELPPEGATL